MPLIIANWKMHMNKERATDFCKKILSSGVDLSKFIIASPTPYLGLLIDAFDGINFCAQDVSIFEGEGQYTGQFSSMMLSDIGIKYAIIGHNETRNLSHDTNQIVHKKAINCINAGIVPIICIGESIRVRESGNYKEFLLNQLVESVPILNNPMIIGYEPSWSIGTGLIPNDIIEIFEIIKSFLSKNLIVNNVSLVYGGSVNLNNVAQILSIKNIDGVLIGKISLDPNNLTKIANI